MISARCFFLLCALAPWAQSVMGQSDALVDFELRDQFDQIHRSSDYDADVLVVIGSDRDGSEYNAQWANAIADAFRSEVASGQVEFIGVADLSVVPFFLRRMVKRRFPKEPDEPVLLDWRGQFTQTYGFESGKVNIVAFSRGRELIHRSHGRSLTADGLVAIVNAIRSGIGDSRQ